MTTRHLDLGCGARPRNPYRRDELHGIDIAPRHGQDAPASSDAARPEASSPEVRSLRRPPLEGGKKSGGDSAFPCAVRRANLALEPIPYPDDHFDSVSAYDFFEHVPRVLPTADGQGTRFPFIELMNEVWRVLVPGGLLYAYTPCYPHPMAFQDPTHVNIVTRDTHRYFTRPTFTGRMYGFDGDFSVVRVLPALVAEFEYEPAAKPGWLQRYRLLRRERRRENTHVVWEFAAHK